MSREILILACELLPFGNRQLLTYPDRSTVVVLALESDGEDVCVCMHNSVPSLTGSFFFWGTQDQRWQIRAVMDIPSFICFLTD